jgi:hypothetical protein
MLGSEREERSFHEKILYRFYIAILSDEATKSTSYKHISFDVAIVSL